MRLVFELPSRTRHAELGVSRSFLRWAVAYEQQFPKVTGAFVALFGMLLMGSVFVR